MHLQVRFRTNQHRFTDIFKAWFPQAGFPVNMTAARPQATQGEWAGHVDGQVSFLQALSQVHTGRGRHADQSLF